MCLDRAGYDFKRLFTLSEYYDRSAFYRAIPERARTKDMDLTGWLAFFIEGLVTWLNEVSAADKRAFRRDVIAREYGLNPRQALVVGRLLEQAELRVDDVEKLCPGVAYRQRPRGP